MTSAKKRNKNDLLVRHEEQESWDILSTSQEHEQCVNHLEYKSIEISEKEINTDF